MPINATVLNCQEYFRREDAHSNMRVPTFVWVYAILWTLSFIIFSGFSFLSFTLFVALLVGIAGHGK